MDSQTIIIIVSVVGVFGIGLVFSLINARKYKAKTANMVSLKESNPDVARIYFFGKNGMTDKNVTVYTINDETFFNTKNYQMELQGTGWQMILDEKNKNNYVSIYALPGTIKVNAAYSYTRPGVTAKSVTKYTDPVDLNLTVEANKSYLLNFDMDLVEFTFEEYHDA